MTGAEERLTRAEAKGGTEMPFDAPLPNVEKGEVARPIVRARPGATAHPAPESWPTAREDTAQSARLQRRLVAVAATGRSGAEKRLVVVVPSRTIDRWREPAAEAQAYEERMLSALFELRDPNLRMVYVSSSPVAPSIISYYLSLLPRGLDRCARQRLSLIALGDRSTRPLSEKLLERPRVLERIRDLIREQRPAQLVTYSATAGEHELALALDLPLYGPDPRHSHLGTKSGSRKLFALTGIPHPLGVEDIRSRADAVHAIARLRAIKPCLTELVVKLEDGVSGEGNGIINLLGLPAPGAADELQRIETRLAELVPCVGFVGAAGFLDKLARHGGIVEERITGRELRSPSVQFQIAPGGALELVSTHDQILDGPSGQRYRGCRFPADPAYASKIAVLASRAAHHLAGIGVIGRFAIDFIVVRSAEGLWAPFAIELNLRIGGTTHPFQTLTQLVGGRYDPATARFITATGQHRNYVATDYFENHRLPALGRERVLSIARSDLRFDRARGIGTVFHMLGPLRELGRVGITAISDGAETATGLFHHARATLIAQAAANHPLPSDPTCAPAPQVA